MKLVPGDLLKDYKEKQQMKSYKEIEHISLSTLPVLGVVPFLRHSVLESVKLNSVENRMEHGFQKLKWGHPRQMGQSMANLTWLQS